MGLETLPVTTFERLSSNGHDRTFAYNFCLFTIFSSIEDDLKAAQNEWDEVQCIEPIMHINNRTPNGSPSKKLETLSEIPLSRPIAMAQPTINFPHFKVTPHIDFDEVWEFFMRQDMSHVMVSH